MISKLLYAFETGVRSVVTQPQIIFALLLTVLLPLAFLYSGNQFLDAGKSYQDRLLKDRVGMLHDTFVLLLETSSYDAKTVAIQLEEIATLNPDIEKFRIAQFAEGEIIPIAALDTDVVGVPEEEKELYKNAAVRTDESIIFEFYVDSARTWQAFRATQASDGTMFFVMTEFSLAGVDSLLQSKKNSAYITLGVIYICVLAIAYWLIRVTDYRYLYQRSQQAMRNKDLFTNMIAHELRAPLTAIRGYASMLQESKTATAEDKKSADRVYDSAVRLIAIVNDLLDVARLQSGKLSVTNSPTDISNIIVSVTEELSAIAREKQIILSHAGTDNSHVVTIDQKRMHQALTNLVSNALKYTKKGEITVAINEKPRVVEIRVQDTGMGISAEDQQKLFAPFFRVQNDDVNAITGTGLGMWITRQLIELMGATIGVESIKGIGTHIVITIPKTSS